MLGKLIQIHFESSLGPRPAICAFKGTLIWSVSNKRSLGGSPQRELARVPPMSKHMSSVMVGPVPAIHVFIVLRSRNDVDATDEHARHVPIFLKGVKTNHIAEPVVKGGWKAY